MTDFTRIRQAAAAGSAERDRLGAQLAATSGALASAKSALLALQASGDGAAIQQAAAQVRALVEQRAATARAIGTLQEQLRATLDDLLHADLALEGSVPLVLLPVRVETRSTADGACLRVRIFHDALHAESLDEGLSDSERSAGIAYWNSVWPSGDTASGWTALVSAVGGRRAPWVAESLRPLNVAQRLLAAPDFPATSPRSGRPAMARTLPDRFYVRVEQDGAQPLVTHGGAIPDELPIGLTDRDEFTALRIGDEDLPPIDESLRWLVDYDEAERVGMAVTVALPLPGRPVRRLLVYGVRAALDAVAGAARLDRLVRSHRYTDGAQFVAQGTPTNNTDSARTDWSRRVVPGAPTLDATPLPAGANADVVATALGLDRAALALLPGAGDAEQARAQAFNAALWTTTWGDAIEHLTPAGRANGDQRLDSPSLDAVRDHWVSYVHGRGPLPILRLGRQPYGLLPVIATDPSYRPLRGAFVEDRLVPFIQQQVRWMWNDAQADAVTVMNRPLDAALPDILGTDAILRGLRVRTALSPDPVMQGATALLLPDLGDDASGQEVTKALLILSGVADDELDQHDLLGTKTRTLALPLVHETDPAFVAGLLQPDPPRMAPKSVLQVLLAHAHAVEERSRAAIAGPDMRGILRESVASAHADIDRVLVMQALDSVFEPRAGDARLVAQAASVVTRSVGRLDLRAVADRHPLPALAPATTIQQIAGENPRLDRLPGNVGLQIVGELFHRTNWAAEFRAALETILHIDSLEERRLLLSETLDCCSHRLDAWITSAASRRLADLRSGGAQGAFLGAYGWLEKIELHGPADAGQVDGRAVLHDGADGGYVHAPGLAHAATAGILRSGRLTHRRGDPNNEAMDIDVSSTRMRDALDLLDGMRHGQTLGALLGYRLERRLHERSVGGLELDRFIYVLRSLAPLRGGKLTEPGVPVEEALAASDVVDGLRLMELLAATILNKLSSGPDDQRYIVPPDHWIAPRPGEAEAVMAAIAELERTHDAVADLLLAESVHQLVAGNPARAAATLDVLGAGEAVPPEPDVVRTPRTGVPIQNRIAIVVADPLPAPVAGWNTAAARSLAEPRLDRWAQYALGDPAAIRIATGSDATLADANLCALDVLYDADGDSIAVSTLASRLHHLIPDLGDDLSPLATTWELAGMLRALLLAGRALDVADLGARIEEGSVGRLADADELIARATAATATFRSVLAFADPLRDLPPFGVRPPPVRSTLPLSSAETAAARVRLMTEATTRADTAEHLLAQIVPATPRKSRIEIASKALATIFGSGFVVAPRVLPPPLGEPDLWSGALGAAGVRARSGADIRPWLMRMGALRANTSNYGATVLVREAFGRAPLLRVAQSPAAAYGTWVGLPFPQSRPPTVPLTSMVIELAGAAAGDAEPDASGSLAGLLVDDWTEVVPRRLERHDPKHPDADPELVDVTTSGVAINANAPAARPPQAILLALSPDGADWNGERLVQLLDETMALARMRTLTLQQIPFIGRYLPALYFRDWSLQGEPVIDWEKVSVEFRAENTLKYLSADR
jgi:hypothetical protein